MNYIVVNPNGLNVRAQMSTGNSKNLLRRMSFGEGFVVHEIYNVKHGVSLETWGRVSDNGGGISQEYVCLQIANRIYAKLQGAAEAVQSGNWAQEVDAFLRGLGYRGAKP